MALNATQWIWHNGRMVPWEHATVHVMSHALHYGSSVFEGIRAYPSADGVALFRLRDHVRRLFDSARIYRMPIPYTVEQIEDACRAVVRDNRLARGAYLRPLVFRGYGALNVCPPGDLPIECVVAAIEWGAYLGGGALEHGIDACVTSWSRPAPGACPTLAKAGGNYLNGYLIGEEAQRHGYAEGIALGPDGLLSEGSGENLFIVRNRTLLTPPSSASILVGLTRDSVLALATRLGFDVREQRLARELLYLADEAFFTGTACEITPIRSIDGQMIGDGARGPVTQALQDAFFGLFAGTTRDEWGWLDPLELPAGTGVTV